MTAHNKIIKHWFSFFQHQALSMGSKRKGKMEEKDPIFFAILLFMTRVEVSPQ